MPPPIYFLLASLWKRLHSISKIVIKHWKICFFVLFFIVLLVMISHFLVTEKCVLQKSSNKNIELICQVHDSQNAGALRMEFNISIIKYLLNGNFSWVNLKCSAEEINIFVLILQLGSRGYELRSFRKPMSELGIMVKVMVYLNPVLTHTFFTEIQGSLQ